MAVIPFRQNKPEEDASPDASPHDGFIEEIDNPLRPRGQEQAITEEHGAALVRQHNKMRMLVYGGPIILLVCFLIYWVAAFMSNRISDDLNYPENIRQTWSSPWAGVSASIIEREYTENVWSPSAHDWTPVARLTGMPSWQTGLAEAIGQHAALASEQVIISEGESDADLATAARLLSGSVNETELRAAREAFVSYDGRVRRHRVSDDVSAVEFVQRLNLMASWASGSSRELLDVFHTADAWPLDDHAVVSIYRARARAYVAHRLISAVDSHYRDQTSVYREAALGAWARAAQFSPLLVVNGNPDSLFFSSHAASMRSLLIEAENATQAYAEAITPPRENAGEGVLEEPVNLIETGFFR